MSDGVHDGDGLVESAVDEPRVGFAERAGQLVGWVLAVALCAGAMVVIVTLFRGPRIQTGPRPGVLETIFASRVVVGVVRVAILFGAGYIVISICALIGRRQWLRRFGPVEVAESVSGLLDANAELSHALDDAQETIGVLEEQLKTMTEAYEGTNAFLEELLESAAHEEEGTGPDGS